jgi:hypothetical protein
MVEVSNHTWGKPDKGHFTRSLSVEQTKDSNNMICGEQKFVHLAFALKANGQRTMPSKKPTWQYFLRVLIPKVCPVEESLSMIFMGTQTLFSEQTFLSKLIQTPQFIYFNRLLPHPLKGSLSKVLWTQRSWCEAPLAFVLFESDWAGRPLWAVHIPAGRIHECHGGSVW